MTVGMTYMRFRPLAEFTHLGVRFQVARWRLSTGKAWRPNYFALLLEGVEVAGSPTMNDRSGTAQAFADRCVAMLHKGFSPAEKEFREAVYRYRDEVLGREVIGAVTI